MHDRDQKENGNRQTKFNTHERSPNDKETQIGNKKKNHELLFYRPSYMLVRDGPSVKRCRTR